MSRLREQLRRVALAFADQLYEVLRAESSCDVPTELGGASTAARARPRPAKSRSARRTGTPSPEALEQVIVYVVEHPGTKPKAIIDDLGLRRPAVFAALNAACEMGALVKSGAWRNVTYYPAGYAPDTKRPAAASPSRARSVASGSDLDEQVVAFIAAHPGCSRADLLVEFPVSLPVLRRALESARLAKRIRMEGTRRTARYEPVLVATSSR